MYERPYISSLNRYLKLPTLSVRWMCQSGLTDRISVKGGTRTAVSAKLILKAKPKGMRKKTTRKSSGGKIMSHFARRFSHSPRGKRAGARKSSRPPRPQWSQPAAPAFDRRVHLRLAYLRAVANDGGKSSGHRKNVTRHRSVLLRLQGVNAGRVSAIPGCRVRGTIAGARDAAQIQTGCRVGADGRSVSRP